MHVLDPKRMSERDNYKLLTGSIIPRPVAFTTTISADGVVNGAPFSYFNIVSSNPPMISLAIQRRNGKMKDTARNIADNKQFVVHIVDTDNVAEMNKTAATLAPDESELSNTSLTQVNSSIVKVPAIQQAKVRMECQLVQMISLPQDDPGSDLIIGEVVCYHIAESIYEQGKINAGVLGAVSRLAGASYAEIGERFELERPQ